MSNLYCSSIDSEVLGLLMDCFLDDEFFYIFIIYINYNHYHF